MTPSMYIATAAWLCLITGYLLRKTPAIHSKLMLSGITLDVCLVLYLQFSRGAIQTALSFKLSVLEQLHILCSSVALVLYAPIVVLGVILLRSKAHSRLRAYHVRIGTTALIMRTLGFALMFSMLR